MPEHHILAESLFGNLYGILRDCGNGDIRGFATGTVSLCCDLTEFLLAALLSLEGGLWATNTLLARQRSAPVRWSAPLSVRTAILYTMLLTLFFLHGAKTALYLLR